MRKEIAIWRREIQEECVWIQQRACESQEREARRRKEGLNIKNQNCSNDMRMVTDATAVAEVKAMWVASPQLQSKYIVPAETITNGMEASGQASTAKTTGFYLQV